MWLSLRAVLRLSKIIRFYDLSLSIIILLAFSPIYLVIFIVCFLESGRPLFIQERIGKHGKPFKLIKFRTMRIETPSVASHLVNENLVTKFGRILRKLKFDELPQIINVIKGDMSLIGPRPCLPNQSELIQQRKARKVFSVKPGITGLAQIKGIDMSNPEKLTKVDEDMIFKFNQFNYFKYLFLTIYGKGYGDRLKVKRKNN